MDRTQGVAKGIWAVALACFLFFASSAQGAAPELLLRFPEDRVQPGSGAAQLNNPRAVAGNPATGHLFVSDLGNARISEYTAWGFFVKSWGWGVADGSAELQTCGPPQPQAAPDPSLCRAGIEGDKPGQINRPIGLAVDSEGNVYVHDRENRRIQKFNGAAEFLLMFGGDVNKTKVAAAAPQAQRDVCPIDPGDVCGAGTVGPGPSQLASSVHDLLAYSPALDAIVVGGEDRIQIFELNGAFREQIDFEGALAAFDGETVEALDVDLAGNIYLVLAGLPDVYKLSATGEPLVPGKPGESSFELGDPLAVAVDADGRVYGVERPSNAFPGGSAGSYVLGFEADGSPIEGMEPQDRFAQPETDAFPEFSGPVSSDLIGIGTNMCAGSPGPNLYAARFDAWDQSRSYVSAYGPAPVGCEPPPPRPPDILDQYASSVGTDGATVKAQINPRFWADTTYYVEYGTGRCSEGGCGETRPLPPGTLLTDGVVNAVLTTAGIPLQGLAPDTTYHFRFVAESSGGGPVYGTDPDGRDGPKGPTPTDGLEGTFTTFALPQALDPCPNDAVRGGASANLPDCRAYELVSPLEKGNTDVGLLSEGRFVEMNQTAISGNRFTFSSTAPFGDPGGAPYISQYVAERGVRGWASKSISPGRTTSPISADQALKNEYKAFSLDLCQAWLRHNSAARLTGDAVLGYPNLYRRENCADPPSFEAITTLKPPNRPADDYSNLAIKGFSDDGSHTVFAAEDKLHKDAPLVEPFELLLYERVGGETRFVCYLPDGKPSQQACSAGTAGGSGPEVSSMHNAVSADGSHIFWTAFSGRVDLREAHPGKIYVRIDGKETVAVSESVTSSAAFFWTAADDGSKAIFEVFEGPLKGNLYEFDVASQTPNLIAKDVEGPLGASEDASKIYLASTADLDGPGPGSAGAHNLYRYDAEAGGFEHLMELAGEDFGGLGSIPAAGIPKAVHRQPAARWATVSPDGRFAAFTSVATPPGGYDNRDVASGSPASEVYRYDSTTDELRCLSCNPTGARPAAADIAGFAVAARLPGWEMNFHSPHVLSDDGRRVFFESHEALVPADTNGAWDVYQWEAPGKGTCSTDDATFGEDTGGCVELISSGRSPANSTFLDADPSGESAFIATQASLVAPDYGLNDVYVARVGGGFPEPRAVSECEGEACQSPPPAPPTTTPGSFSHQGPADPKVKPRPRPCPKGKRRVKRAGKVKCVPKKRRGKVARRRGSTGRAGR